MLLALAFACATSPAAPSPPPIVLISLDTLRADRVGAFGGEDTFTPNLDAFAAESIVFEQAYSQASQTAPSHATTFTGIYPSELLRTDLDTVIETEQPFLAEVLSLYGYQTAAFVGGGDLAAGRGLEAGFATWSAPRPFGSLHDSGPPALAWLTTVDRTRPWFLFVHGYDAHAPYVEPAPYGHLHADARYDGLGATIGETEARRFLDGVVFPSFNILDEQFRHTLRPRTAAGRAAMLAEVLGDTPPTPVTAADVAHVRRAYDGGVSYVDALFGLLITAFAARGVLDEAIVVVMSDHGEQLGEHGVFWHGTGLDDEETHVVLMVRMPGGRNAGRQHDLVELADVMPTLVEAAGGVLPAGVEGRSFLPALQGAPWRGRALVHAQTNALTRTVSVRSEAGRLTYVGMEPGSPHFADLVEAARIGGPGLQPSPGLPEPSAERMRGEMVAWARSLHPPPRGPGTPLDAELVKTLRAHGYWGGSP